MKTMEILTIITSWKVTDVFLAIIISFCYVSARGFSSPQDLASNLWNALVELKYVLLSVQNFIYLPTLCVSVSGTTINSSDLNYLKPFSIFQNPNKSSNSNYALLIPTRWQSRICYYNIIITLVTQLLTNIFLSRVHRKRFPMQAPQ